MTARTVCPAGHPQTGDNVYIYRGGRRGCRLCRNEAQRQRRYKLAGKEAPPPPTPGMCRKGLHPLVEGNLYHPPSGRRRQCLTCHTAALKASNARLTERRRAARAATQTEREST